MATQTAGSDTFEPVTVPKNVAAGGPRRKRDLAYAKGLTTGEIQAHLAEICDTIPVILADEEARKGVA